MGLDLRKGIVALTATTFLASCAAYSENGQCSFGGIESGVPGEPDVVAIGTWGDARIDKGPEDFAVLPLKDGGWRLFVSVTARGLFSGGSQGRIRSVVVGEDGKFGKVSDLVMPKNIDGGFHPVGLSLVEQVDGHRLYVINTSHQEGENGQKTENRIEYFNVEKEGKKLTHLGSLDSDELIAPNDLLATKDGPLYVSNPWKPKFYRLDRLSNWPSLIRLHGSDMSSPKEDEVSTDIVDSDFSFANGILQPSKDRLLVADFGRRELVVYDVSGEPDRLGEIPMSAKVKGDSGQEIVMDGAPDNLMMGEGDSKVYIAAHRSDWATFMHMSFGAEAAPSLIFELDLTDTPLDSENIEKIRPKLILDDAGKDMKASSTAMLLGKHLIVSQLKQPEIYAFSCESK